jgi:uncharacterized protein (DUF488 family)
MANPPPPPEVDHDSKPTIFSVGHSTRPFDHLIGLLSPHQIELAVDIRSRPWIKHAPHFNQDQLRNGLAQHGISYLWLGEHLGQRPEGDQYYDPDGYALYDVISREPWFMKAIGRVEYEADRQNVALLCLEEQPERCHRFHLVGRVLTERGAELHHLRHTGVIETQGTVSQRLGEGQGSLLDGDTTQVWRSPEPMQSK